MVPMAVVARNIYCPYYTHCLDNAAQENAPGWSCDKCEHRLARGGSIDETEFLEYYLLLWGIFKPELLRRYREMQRRGAFDRQPD